MTLIPSQTFAAEVQTGFGFCAPPARPACIEGSAPFSRCEGEVQAYLRTVFHYRACLEREAERAIREANKALDIWKCRKEGLECR